MESDTSFENIKNNPKLLLSLIGKHVKLKLIQNLSLCGFVHAIDPIKHSIILLEPIEDSFKTTLIPGHAILDISETVPIPNIKPPLFEIDPNVDKMSPTNIQDKKRRLMSWLKSNHLPVSELDENIVFGNAMIMPPYNVTNIYSINTMINMRVKDIMEKMPEDFEEL